MKNQKQHICLVDGSTYIFRAYHALPPLTRKSDGFPVGAISGFCNMLDKLIKDEREKNLRKVLNFGHTFAHAYEGTLNFSKKLNHGEAVILGMKSAFEFSHSRKMISNREYESVINHLNNSHFPISIKNYFTIKKISQIISFMMRDKKNNSKNIKLMLIKKIGGPIIEKEISDVTIKLFLKKKLIN